MKQTETKATLKRDGNYARVDDEATLILTYPGRPGDHSGILELARPPQGLGDLRHARLRLHSGRKERPYGPAGQQTDRAVAPECCRRNTTTASPTLPLCARHGEGGGH